MAVIKKLRVHPTNAARVQLPDGRYLAYQELGVSAERARYSLVTPHSFISSRLAGNGYIQLVFHQFLFTFSFVF